MPRRDPKYDLQRGYAQRVLGCTAAALLLLIALVTWWPARPAEGGDTPDLRIRGQETIRLEEIRPARQAQSRPPPPPPIPPVAVPDEIVLEERPPDLDDILVLSPGPPGPDAAPPAGNEGSTPQADVYEDPRAVRYAEADYPRAADRQDIRAEIVVRVQVDPTGNVQSAEITERYLLGEERERVAALGYGLEEAALEAARRFGFRPARRNGKPIDGEAVVTFRFGV